MKICIDIGGTQTRVAQINEQLEIEDVLVISTSDPITTLGTVLGYINEKPVSQINISTCGPINVETGVYGNLPNLPNWIGFNIKEYILNAVSCDIYIENDANCATLYESELRPDISNLVYITLSTGVGGGAIIDNELLNGPTNDAVSPYKYYVTPKATIEQLCSGTGLLKQGQEIDPTITETKEIFAPEKYQEMNSILDEWTTTLAVFFVNVNALIEPQLIVLGGSVIVNNPSFINKISMKMKRMNCSLKLELTDETEYNALKGAYLIEKYK